MTGLPKTPKGKIAKEKIASAASALFTRKGFSSSNVADICREAGSAIGSFYRYFENKQEVLQCLIDLLRDSLYRKFSTLHTFPKGEPRVGQSFHLFFQFVVENLQPYQALRESEFVYEEGARSFYHDYRKVLAREFDFMDPISTRQDIFLDAVVGMQMFFAMKWLLWEKRKTIPDETVRALSHLAVNGIFNRHDFDFSRCKAIVSEKKMDHPSEKILRATEYVFGKYGYPKGSVAEICRKAGVSVGYFYLHFDSKKAAIRGATLLLRDRLLQNSLDHAQGARSRTEEEILALWAFFGFIQRHPHGYRLVREAEFVDPQLAADYYLPILDAYVRRIRKSVQKEEYKIEDYDVLALAMMGIAHTLGLRHVLWGKKSVDEKWFCAIVDYLFFGMTMEKDRRKSMDMFEYWKKMAGSSQQCFDFWQNMMKGGPQNLAALFDPWKPMIEALQKMGPKMADGWSTQLSQEYLEVLDQKALGIFQEWDKKVLGKLQEMASSNFMDSFQKLMQQSLQNAEEAQNRDPGILAEYWQGMFTEYLKDMEMIAKDVKKIDLQHLVEIGTKASTGNWDESVQKYGERFWDSLKTKMQYGPEYYTRPQEVQVGPTPKETVWEKGIWKLYHYAPSPEKANRIPIFIVYALINRYYIEDLAPGCSLVQYFTEKGFDVYVTDWGTPSYEDRHLTLDQYIEEGIGGMVDFIRKKHEVERVSLLGHCMGGVLSVIYTALHPDKVSRLVTLTAPMTARKGGVVSAWTYLSPIDLIVDTFGNVPAKLIRYTFIAMKPYYEIIRWNRHYATLDKMDGKALAISNAVDKWVNDNVDIPGEFFRKFMKEVFIKDSLAQGGMTIDGREVKISNIHCPIMNIYGAEDWIVTPGSAEVLNDLVSSQEKSLKKIHGQHLGILFDSRNRVVWDEMNSFFLNPSQA